MPLDVAMIRWCGSTPLIWSFETKDLERNERRVFEK